MNKERKYKMIEKRKSLSQKIALFIDLLSILHLLTLF